MQGRLTPVVLGVDQGRRLHQHLDTGSAVVVFASYVQGRGAVAFVAAVDESLTLGVHAWSGVKVGVGVKVRQWWVHGGWVEGRQVMG